MKAKRFDRGTNFSKIVMTWSYYVDQMKTVARLQEQGIRQSNLHKDTTTGIQRIKIRCTFHRAFKHDADGVGGTENHAQQANNARAKRFHRSECRLRE